MVFVVTKASFAAGRVKIGVLVPGFVREWHSYFCYSS